MERWEIKHHLKALVEDFEAMLGDAASFIAQVDLKHEDSVKLYGVLGHIAANVSVLSEIVNKIND